MRQIADGNILAQPQVEVSAAGGDDGATLKRLAPDHRHIDQFLKVLEDRIAVLGATIRLGKGLRAQNQRIGSVDPGQTQGADGAGHGRRVVGDIFGQRDGRIGGPGQDAPYPDIGMTVKHQPVLGQRDQTRGVLERLPVGIIRSPRHIVNGGPGQFEGHPEFDQRVHLALGAMHALGQGRRAAHMAGADGRQAGPFGAVQIDHVTRTKIARQRAPRLVLDLGPGRVADRGQFAMKVVHVSSPVSRIQGQATRRAVPRVPGRMRAQKAALRQRSRPACRRAARRTGIPSPPG